MGVQIELDHGIGKARVPAGEFGVVVGDIVRIPAEHHVAKSASMAEMNLSLWMYLPRSTPSMSATATLTRTVSDFLIALMMLFGDLLAFIEYQ